MLHLKIKPDGKVRNDKVEVLINSLYHFVPPYRVWFKKDEPSFFSYEILLEKDNTGFFLTIPEKLKDNAIRGIETCWNKSAVEETSDPYFETKTWRELLLGEHCMFSLNVDHRENFINNLMDTLILLHEGDKVFVQFLAIPASFDWIQTVDQAYRQLKQGDYPKKKVKGAHTAKKEYGLKLAKGFVSGVNKMIEITTGSKSELLDIRDEKAIYFMTNDVSKATVQKAKGNGFDLSIRVGVKCEDKTREEAIITTVLACFKELEGDNHLVSRYFNKPELVKERKSIFKTYDDFVNTKELAMMINLPHGTYQKKYNIPSIDMHEVEAPKEVLDDTGIPFAELNYRGKKQTIYFPANNWDELCLPAVAVAKMGEGKTTGLGANTLYEAVKKGWGGLIIDPAKGEVYEELSQVLPPDKIVHLDFGSIAYCLDWDEVKYAKNPKDLLANSLFYFFEDSEDMFRTKKLLRAFIRIMDGTRLIDLQEVMEDVESLKNALSKYVDFQEPNKPKSTSRGRGNINNNKSEDSISYSIKKDCNPSVKRYLPILLDYFDKLKKNQHFNLASPILNRLDDILGNEFMFQCAISKKKIDMVELMSQRKAIVIDVPKSELGITGIETITRLLMSKIDLGMTLRKEENYFPFFVVIDEPHQTLKSANFFERFVVESRKYRVGFRFLMHSFVQLPKQFRVILKSAGGHYFLYPTDKENWKEFIEDIKPFELEEAINLKRFHTINIIRTGGERKVFMSKMLPPPSMRVPNIKHNIVIPKKKAEEPKVKVTIK